MHTLQKLYPLIVTNKLQECGEFYTNLLDFTLIYELDWYIHLRHETSGVELAFMIENAENQPPYLHPKFSGEGLMLSFEVTDAKAEFKQLSTTKGVDVVLPYTEEDWGQSHFIVRDPSGAWIDVVEQTGVED